ncbi:DNA polymerase-3 subunit gamma/tau [Natronocella acetinitrilica]|uniref:DNA polymerase III subunit gamma/tau n=1 Tax=Natronocella acetinitrilica TaxID=414046 RepID=A0AAE3KCX9_9GAMM|nr:DNA polymerase III subunit gamma/tau [Natronocella acetinitrilica]MCP1676221.1 DNA polymerase-3 subunit gamma/tau [Natronocella acetinitrilica]
MSYQVLARKYRPRIFAEMVGQEHVLRALINGLDNDRLHHAFLFTGTRGVGKTTVARVLAKCLNCEAGVSSEPCGVCDACREIDQGRFVDLIEVDAASRTRVEDTRELLDNVQYTPTRGRYKVYLIDEVHMLSQHSFNALLKTLEEPPPHVKFLLATTDPQKVPVTILSRCLQFNLKRLPAALIAGHLQHVLEQEGIVADNPALTRLARAADGSLRDALSLTDQAIAYGGGGVNDDDVRTMLGSMEDDAVLQLLERLAADDGAGLLGVVGSLTERAADFHDVLAGMLGHLHTLSLLQSVPGAVDDNEPERERLQALAESLGPEDVQLFYQIGLQGRRDLTLAPEPRAGFEMIMLRMLHFRPVLEQDTPRAAAPSPAPRADRAAPSAAAPVKPKPPVKPKAPEEPPPADEPPWFEAEPQESTPAPTPEPPPPAAVNKAPPAAAPGKPEEPKAVTEIPAWPTLVEQMRLGGISRALAMHCAWGGIDDDQVVLKLERVHTHLRNKPVEQRIEQALSKALGRKVSLNIELVGEVEADTPAELADQDRTRRQEAAEAAIAGDPNVRALKDLFDAEVIPDSIQPRR